MQSRDQRRAAYAYQCVEAVSGDDRKEYKLMVNDLGTNILRLGLVGAMAALLRRKQPGLLVGHLGGAEIPGLTARDGNGLMRQIQQLDLSSYMLATREALRVVVWLKRAAQAIIREE